MRNFKQLKIWQKGLDIAVQAYRLVQLFPTVEKFGISIQITRAAVSIPSNIAEGSSRSSEKDYRRFIEIALGSSYELETQVLIAQAANMGQEEARKELLGSLQEEQKMLVNFLNLLNK